MRLVLSLRTWLLLSHLAVLSLPVLALAATGFLARSLQDQAREHLLHQGHAIAALARWPLASGDEPALTRLNEAFVAIARESDTRLWLVDGEGHLRATSESSPGGAPGGSPGGAPGGSPGGSPGGAHLGELLDDASLLGALQGQDTVAVRRCGELKAERCDDRELLRVVVATPVREGEQVQGAILLSASPRPLLQAVFYAPTRLLVAAGLALLLTCGLALISGHYLSRSLRALSRTSRRIGEGELQARLELQRPGRSHLAEVAELAGDLDDMTLRLRERLAYIREFASNVSHEFRTPVTTLRGTMELLRDDPEMPLDQRSRFLDNALFDLERTDRLLGGLVALARAEERAEPRDFDLDPVFLALRQRWPALKLPERAGSFVGDAGQIETALSNLVENAFTHGGPDVEVRLGVERAEGELRLDVLDNGLGISASNLDRVFDRFFTTGRERGSTGLGLALVRAICRAHGGEVEVQSRPGRTCFRLRLPLRSLSLAQET